MKKILVLLIMAVSMLPVFAACGIETIENSSNYAGVTQGSADNTASTQGCADSTAAAQGNADSTASAQKRADSTAAARGNADNTTSTQKRADNTDAVQGNADNTALTQGHADNTTVTQGNTNNTSSTWRHTDNTISIHEHIEAIIPAVAATCTKTGLTEGKKCSVCDKILVAQNTVDKLAHTIKNGKCTVCGAACEPELRLSTDKSYYILWGKGAWQGDTLVIPDTYLGLPVKEVRNSAFRYFTIKSLVIGKNITKIGDFAFEGCEELTSIQLGENVQHIGSYAFAECAKLQSFVIPASVKKIQIYAFKNCSSVKEVYFEQASGWECKASSSYFPTKFSEKALSYAPGAADFLTKHYCDGEWTNVC